MENCLTPIKAENLDSTDIKWLEVICKTDFAGHLPAQVVADSITNYKQLWRLRGLNLSGLMVTQVNALPTGKELWVWGVAGYGYRRRLGKIYRELVIHMEKQNIRWLSANAMSDSFGELHTKIGCKKVATLYRLDLGE